MNNKKIPLATLLIISILSLLISSCAGAPRTRELPSELYGQDSVIPTIKFETNQKPIVLLNYIASIDDEIYDSVNDHYMIHDYFLADRKPKDYEKAIKNVDDNVFMKNRRLRSEEALPDAIYKTHYAALELYKLLQTRIGDRATILLSPNKIIQDSSGAFLVRKGCECPPATLMIDFFAYADPTWTPGQWGTQATTTGQYIAPILTISTQHKFSPDTAGLLAAPKQLTNMISDNGGEINDPANAGIFQLINKHLLWSDESRYADRLSEVKPIEKNKIMVYPYMLFEMENLDSRESLYGNFTPIVVAIADGLNSIATQHTEISILGAYAVNYDPELASDVTSGVILDNRQKAQTRILMKFLEAEIAFVEARDEKYYDSVMDGEWAQSVYALRQAEKERNSKANTAQALGMLAAAVAVPTAVPVYSIANMTQANVDGINGDYDTAFSNFENEQFEFSLNLQNVSMSVKAKSIPQLREKLLTIYNDVSNR